MIRIKELRKKFKTRHGGVEALAGISLDIVEGEFCVLLGPSGCGKTTTLRCVAGLEKPDAGEIEISGALVNSTASNVHVPTEKRDIGMVFQSYAIWPHMTVFQNVSFPLTQGRRRCAKSEVAQRVTRALHLVKLDSFHDRPATDLSGGQQQRVAMARAVVTEPKILLMDEPLSNLDAQLRQQMRLELKKITGSIGVTTLYVTHDQDEALSLGDRVCVMNGGRIVQVGTPYQVYSDPSDLFVAEFLGDMNVVKGSVAGPARVDSPFGAIDCAVPSGVTAGAQVTLAIRPEYVRVSSHAPEEFRGVQGKIVSKTYLGDSAVVEVEACGVLLKSKLPGDSDIAVGQRAAVAFGTDRWRVYP